MYSADKEEIPMGKGKRSHERAADQLAWNAFFLAGIFFTLWFQPFQNGNAAIVEKATGLLLISVGGMTVAIAGARATLNKSYYNILGIIGNVLSLMGFMNYQS